MHTYAEPGKDKIALYESAECLYPGAANAQWTNSKQVLEWEAVDFDPFVLNSKSQIEYLANPLLVDVASPQNSTGIMIDNATWKVECAWLFVTVQNLTAEPIEACISIKGIAGV